jgi:predicted TIM-barrel fold metal-dependent hydrolase
MEVTYYVGSVYKDLAPRSDILEAARRYPGFFVPFGCIDFTLGPEQADQMKELGFHGLKAIRPHLPYDDPSFLPIYERAAALKMPILFHVGIIAKNTPDEMVPFRSLGPTNMRPSMLDGIAAAFPELPLIAGHMGFPWENELFECLYYYPNTYCAVCGYVDYSWLMSQMDRRCPTINNPHETVSDRMLFATDTCYGRPESHNSAARFADFMGMFFRYVGRSYQWGLKGDAFLRGNARRIVPGTK